MAGNINKFTIQDDISMLLDFYSECLIGGKSSIRTKVNFAHMLNDFGNEFKVVCKDKHVFLDEYEAQIKTCQQ